jgi:hypothetical protein
VRRDFYRFLCVLSDLGGAKLDFENAMDFGLARLVRFGFFLYARTSINETERGERPKEMKP